MKAATVKAWHQAKALSTKPHQQGDLDCLCGLYAIVNACQIACRSVDLKRSLDCSQLLTFLIDDLERRQKLAEVFCYGIGIRNHNQCLLVAQKYLLGKHRLYLNIKRPFARTQETSMKNVFGAIDQHLQKPGSSALIDVVTSSYEHWTVISRIEGRKVYFADSDGMKPRSIGDFQFKSENTQLKRNTVAFARASLALLKVKLAYL